MNFQPAITFLLRRSGAVMRVLQDELGLANCFPSDVLLTSLVAPGSLPQAEQLLEAMRESKAALDVKLKIVVANESVSLFFAGYKTQRGFKLIGAKEPISRDRLLEEVTQVSDRTSETHLVNKSKPEKTGLTQRDLLASTAHEMRNHLNGILAASQYLLEDAAGLLEAEHVTLLRSIESTARVTYNLMDDIGEAFAIESGGMELDLKPTDILSVIKENLSANRSRASRQGIRLELVTPDVAPLIEADPVRISRVIETLLASAISFSNLDGSVEVSVALKDRQVLISVWAKKTALSGENLRRIIHLDWSGIKELKAATVLAFAVTRRIVEEHGGAIHVEEGYTGQGLIIRLELPSQQDESGEKVLGNHG